MDTVKARTHGALLGWALLCALAFGVIAMHHVSSMPAASHVAVAAEAGHGHPAPSEECGHDEQHACKAVLSAAGTAHAVAQPAILIDSPDDRVSTFQVCPGKPAPAGRLLLTSVCVFRL